MISVLVDKMIRTQIVDCAAVANWLFSQDMAHEFTRSDLGTFRKFFSVCQHRCESFITDTSLVLV